MSIHSHEVDISKSEFNLDTFSGRFQHFFKTTSPVNCFKTNEELDDAKKIVDSYRAGKPLPGVTVAQLWNAKYTYDSAFHPDTGEKVNIFGRMACQMPANTFITGCLLQFYKTTPAVIFWQWTNQSFNAFVNYCNRSGDSPLTPTKLGLSYVLATSGAVSTAMYINSKVKNFPPIYARLVPFAAVMAANFINISCMRSADLTKGIAIMNDAGEKVAESPKAGRIAIFQVAVSRIFMCTPGMLLPPVVMDILERRCFLAKFPWSGIVIQMLMCGSFLIFTTPAGCAIWPQVKTIKFNELESSAQNQIKAFYGQRPIPSNFFYNKGL